jgi:nitrate reductase NapE component
MGRGFVYILTLAFGAVLAVAVVGGLGALRHEAQR